MSGSLFFIFLKLEEAPVMNLVPPSTLGLSQEEATCSSSCRSPSATTDGSSHTQYISKVLVHSTRRQSCHHSGTSSLLPLLCIAVVHHHSGTASLLPLLCVAVVHQGARSAPSPINTSFLCHYFFLTAGGQSRVYLLQGMKISCRWIRRQDSKQFSKADR